MNRKPFIYLVLALLLSSYSGSFGQAQDAPMRLANVFGEHMVLQRDQPIPVWGWAAPGQEITISLADKEKKTIADETGKWLVKLDSLPAGGPHELVVAGKQKVSVADILIGEVWLCSGQSNMAMTVQRSNDFDKEKGLADVPNIRMITVARNATPTIQEDCSGEWTVATPDTVGKFSATAWFFGRKLHEELDVPIGLINSSWGGTDVAAWTSRSAQKEKEVLALKMKSFDEAAKSYDAEKAQQKFDEAMKVWEEKKANGEKPGNKPRLKTDPMVNQNRPSNLFNGMIDPLVPYGIKGVIWYQGEHNARNIESAKLYSTQLKTLVTDWRTRWDIGDFPFITVQLPNFRQPAEKPVQNTGWVFLRESQMKILDLENTGIAITTDVGMANDIHPKNKQAVGQRLALWALGTTYKQDILYSGPIVSFFQLDGPSEKKPVGRATFFLSHVGDGLKTSDGEKKIRGFAIAGDDQVFYPANAQYNKKGRKLLVSSKKVEYPVAVRYNWADNPSGNLVNSAGLPAAPFRTDTWEVEPEEK